MHCPRVVCAEWTRSYDIQVWHMTRSEDACMEIQKGRLLLLASHSPSLLIWTMGADYIWLHLVLYACEYKLLSKINNWKSFSHKGVIRHLCSAYVHWGLALHSVPTRLSRILFVAITHSNLDSSISNQQSTLPIATSIAMRQKMHSFMKIDNCSIA